MLSRYLVTPFVGLQRLSPSCRSALCLYLGPWPACAVTVVRRCLAPRGVFGGARVGSAVGLALSPGQPRALSSTLLCELTATASPESGAAGERCTVSVCPDEQSCVM